jgi:hypothetical protein
MYCKRNVTTFSEKGKVANKPNLLWWHCAPCGVYVEYKGKRAKQDELSVVKFECKFNNKDYYIYINYISETTTISYWDETDDGFQIGAIGIVIPVIMRNINPTSARNKLATLLIFS